MTFFIIRIRVGILMELDVSHTENAEQAHFLVTELLDAFYNNKTLRSKKKERSNTEWYDVFSKKRGKKRFRHLLHIDHQTFYLLTAYLYQNGGEAVEIAKNMNVCFATTIARGVLSMASRGIVDANAAIMMCSKTSFLKSAKLFLDMLLHVKDKVIRVPPKENFRYFKNNAGEVFKGAVLAIGNYYCL